MPGAAETHKQKGRTYMKRVVIALTVAALLVVASVAMAKGGLNGSWSTKIKSPKNLKGTWTLTFTPGHYVVKVNGSKVTKGTDTIKGNKISVTDSTCKATGVYKYKITGNKLSFTKVKDGKTCTGRAAVLSHTFTRLVK
jgi:lipopolysaccharide export system protein LptA